MVSMSEHLLQAGCMIFMRTRTAKKSSEEGESLKNFRGVLIALEEHESVPLDRGTAAAGRRTSQFEWLGDPELYT